MKLGYFLLASLSHAQDDAGQSGENTDGITDNTASVENVTVVENVSTWSDWGECSKKCGVGVRTRIMEPCEDQCQLEEENCNESECNWSEWIQDECSKTCGSGIAVRKRECPEEHQCIGSAVESVKCGSECESEVTNSWGEWSNWSDCTKSCATNGKGGSTTRTRECDGTNLSPIYQSVKKDITILLFSSIPWQNLDCRFGELNWISPNGMQSHVPNICHIFYEQHSLMNLLKGSSS